jgi:UTP--glucose-1-phosphate uridylyltransferase
MGERMRPISELCAKEALPLGARPAIDWIIDEVVSAELGHVVLVTSPRKTELNGYLDSAVRDRLGDAGCSVRIVHQPCPDGTVNAMLRGVRELPDESAFILAWGDEVFRPARRMTALVERVTETEGLMPVVAGKPVSDEDVSRCGIIELDGERIRRIVEKPDPHAVTSRLASVGGYALTWPVVRLAVARQERYGADSSISQLLSDYISEGGSATVAAVDEDWHTTGDWPSYERAFLAFAAR